MSHLYAVQFSGGLVKVGRSENPDKRIQQHRHHAESMGMVVSQSLSAVCIGSVAAAESRLIDECAKSAAGRRNREWFIGLEFDLVSAVLREACSPPPPPPAPPAPQQPAVPLRPAAAASSASLLNDLICAGLTQTEIAKRAGMAQYNVSRWYSGDIPSAADAALRLHALHAEICGSNQEHHHA